MQKFYEWLPGLAVVVLIIAAGYGWGANIYYLATEYNNAGMFVLRVVGIFVAPLGAVLGYV